MSPHVGLRNFSFVELQQHTGDRALDTAGEIPVQRLQCLVVSGTGNADVKGTVSLDKLRHVLVDITLATGFKQLLKVHQVLLGTTLGRKPCAFGFQHALQFQVITLRRAIDIAHGFGSIDIASHEGSVPLLDVQDPGIGQGANRLADRISTYPQLLRQIGFPGQPIAYTPRSVGDIGFQDLNGRIDQGQTCNRGQS